MKVRVTEGKNYSKCMKRIPGEIDFCSSDPEFRVDEGSSYRESTLHAKRTAEMENTCNPAPNVNKKVGWGMVHLKTIKQTKLEKRTKL